MMPTLKACLSLFKIKTLEGFQYRLSGIAGSTTSIFYALIEITIYTIFYNYADNNLAGVMVGLDLKQIVTYVWLGQLFFLMHPFIDGEILDKITSGDVGIEMCRPIDMYFHWFAKTAANRVTPLFWRGSITLIAGIIMPKSYRMSLPDSLLGFLCMLLSTLSAFLLCTSFGMLLCVIRLNIAWGNGLTYIIILIGGVLSGNYLPLRLWPEVLQRFLILQPFAGYLDIPVRLYLGNLLPKDAFWAIGLQLTWALLFVLLGRKLMSIRLKRIVVQGG